MKTLPNFIISLDYELLWGMLDVKNLDKCISNVRGETNAIPEMLDLFEKYNIGVTWAIVGMTLCENYDEWRSFKPQQIPKYEKKGKLTNYEIDIRSFKDEELFFQKDMIKRIAACPRQEIASHSYSHLYFSEPGITNEDISNDFRLFENISFQNNISCKSFIFPRNQVNDVALKELKKHDFKTFRGNLQNFIQKDGHKDSQSLFFKIIRFGDSYIQISKDLSYKNSANENLLNVPGSLFLRPVNSKTPYVLNKMHIKRIKKSMIMAAQNKETFHLWWHPHNFGNSTDDNLLNLRDILEHYTVLSNEHGMTSKNMGEFTV